MSLLALQPMTEVWTFEHWWGTALQDISIGAIGAAIIAALVSLMGLVVSKEQKTSEFRQAWIDSLRTEMVIYNVQINIIVDKLMADYDDHNKKIEALHSHYSELNKASFGIRLRLNPKEKKSRKLMHVMGEFETLSGSDDGLSVDHIKPLEKKFEKAAKNLLKHEWNRVKRGELFFVLVKNSIVVMLFILLAMAGKIIFFQDNSETKIVEKTLQNYKCAALNSPPPAKNTSFQISCDVN